MQPCSKMPHKSVFFFRHTTLVPSSSPSHPGQTQASGDTQHATLGRRSAGTHPSCVCVCQRGLSAAVGTALRPSATKRTLFVWQRELNNCRNLKWSSFKYERRSSRSFISFCCFSCPVVPRDRNVLFIDAVCVAFRCRITLRKCRCLSLS